MTDYATVPSLREFAMMRLAMFAQRRARRAQVSTSAIRVTALANAIVRVVLHVAGFALLTIAAWQWNIMAGFAVAGISCFVFSALMTGGSTDDDRGGNGSVR